MGERISSFRDMKVYRAAFDLQTDVFDLTKAFPRKELFSLTDQIRRSSRAIGANIAEAWQKRRYVAHFVSKLSDADGEQAETQHWFDTALACRFVSAGEHARLRGQCEEIGRMLGRIMSQPEQWCNRFRSERPSL